MSALPAALCPGSGPQSVVHGPEAIASPGNLSEIHILKSPRSSRDGAQQCVLYLPLQVNVILAELESHCTGTDTDEKS